MSDSTKPDTEPKKAHPFVYITVTVAIALAFALPTGTEKAALGAFAVNIVAFLPSAFFQTERFYDLTGSLTYLSLSVWTLTLPRNWNEQRDPAWRQMLLTSMVMLWALRLGTFLFTRIMHDKTDSRFDKVRGAPLRFFVFWFIQGLWCFLTALPVWTINLSVDTQWAMAPFGARDMVGVFLWVLGFSLESVADSQKKAFRANPANEGRFITTGLWAHSRHPNYVGEITLWVGVSLCASSSFQGAQFLSLISPLFVYLLLTKVSGVPLLERKADKKWGGETAYQEYKQRTPVLFPGITR